MDLRYFSEISSRCKQCIQSEKAHPVCKELTPKEVEKFSDYSQQFVFQKQNHISNN